MVGLVRLPGVAWQADGGSVRALAAVDGGKAPETEAAAPATEELLGDVFPAEGTVPIIAPPIQPPAQPIVLGKADLYEIFADLNKDECGEDGGVKTPINRPRNLGTGFNADTEPVCYAIAAGFYPPTKRPDRKN